MTSPWVQRAQSNMLPAVDKTGAIHMVDEREARIAAGLCVISERWCITHEVKESFDHYLDTRPPEDRGHSSLGFAYND